MDLADLIQVARGRRPADLLLRNARVIDVYNHEIVSADVAIAGGRIAGLTASGDRRAVAPAKGVVLTPLTAHTLEQAGEELGVPRERIREIEAKALGKLRLRIHSKPLKDINEKGYQAHEIHDLNGAYLAPGLIDGHVHIESSMVSVPEFARAVAPHGTTTVITDPHEIANVLGMSGIRYMLQAAKYNPLSVYVMASSCVPASAMESAGAELSAYDLEMLMQDKWVLGLAEMMNAPGLLASDPDVLAKIAAAGPRPIDGHAPGLRGHDLNAYVAAGVRSDHECTTLDEAREKLQRGMAIMLREATGARNLADLLPLVTPQNSRRFFFVTDDRNPLHLISEGHIDSMVRQAIGLGTDPLLALELGSLNAAEHFGLRDRGAVAPGRLADLMVFDDLRAPRPRLVYRHGRLVARDGASLPFERPEKLPTLRSSINVPTGTLHFGIPAPASPGRPTRMRVIDIIPNQIITGAGEAEATTQAGEVIADPDRDLLKLAVIERHVGSGRIGLGFVRGFGLRLGALASTVAHDAHNIIVVGASDEAMRAAVEIILSMQGGLVAIAGRDVARLPLPIAGLMSAEPLPAVAEGLRTLLQVARRMGATPDDPFTTLSFLALSVIPALKLTDRGLLDVTRFQLVPLFVD